MDALSGLDLSPVLNGTGQKVTDGKGVERKHLFWHFPHNGKIGMKSAIREGDFKLYKRYYSDDYELYRLYENGQRLDLEEQHDLAKDAAYASVVASLAATLEAELKANDAEMPYLNPAYQDHDKDSASIASSSFRPADRLAKMSVADGGPAIKEAYVIYQGDTAKPKRKTKKQRVAERAAERKRKSGKGAASTEKVEENAGDHSPELTGMKQPVAIAADGHSVTATIPAEVKSYRFLLIDSNNFLQYSKAQTAK